MTNLLIKTVSENRASNPKNYRRDKISLSQKCNKMLPYGVRIKDASLYTKMETIVMENCLQEKHFIAIVVELSDGIRVVRCCRKIKELLGVENGTMTKIEIQTGSYIIKGGIVLC